MSHASEETAPDLYGLLGVHKDASPLAIRQAYRKQAQVYHPDVQGTGDKNMFNQLRLARDVLTNPRWRENYDAVGAIPKDQADNAQAELITMLTGMFGQVMHAVCKEGKDPAGGDFVYGMNNAIKNAFQTLNNQISGLQASKESLGRVKGRFHVKSFEQPNHMETIINGQEKSLDHQLEQCHAQLRQLEIARIYLNDVTYTIG